MEIKAKKVYCSSIYVIDYFYSRVPLSPEVERSTTGWHSFKERQSLAADTERHFFESFRKQELNEFLSICGVPQLQWWTQACSQQWSEPKEETSPKQAALWLQFCRLCLQVITVSYGTSQEDPKICVKHSTPPRQTSLGHHRVLLSIFLAEAQSNAR